MLKFLIPVFFAVLYSAHLAQAAEFREHAMCKSQNEASSFPKVSLQTDPAVPGHGILILQASDGWSQVYSGPVKQTAAGFSFSEEKEIVTASFDKETFQARISFNGDVYECDERSFGN